MTETDKSGVAAHLPWSPAHKRLAITLRPEDGVMVPLGDGRIAESVILTYELNPDLSERLGVPQDGWGYHEAAVMQEADYAGPRRLHTLYDEDALNSPLGGVPDWVYRLFNAYEPPVVEKLVERIELLVSERDLLERRLAEQHTELGEARQQLLDTASVASAAVDTSVLTTGVRLALRMLHDEASTAVSRSLTMAYAVGLAEGEKKALAEHADEALDPEAVRAVEAEAQDRAANRAEDEAEEQAWKTGL